MNTETSKSIISEWILEDRDSCSRSPILIENNDVFYAHLSVFEHLARRQVVNGHKILLINNKSVTTKMAEYLDIFYQCVNPMSMYFSVNNPGAETYEEHSENYLEMSRRKDSCRLLLRNAKDKTPYFIEREFWRCQQNNYSKYFGLRYGMRSPKPGTRVYSEQIKTVVPHRSRSVIKKVERRDSILNS